MECIRALMVEHRLIEKMVGRLRTELNLLEGGSQPHLSFLEAAAKFFVSFVDRLHHGKEQILFDAVGSRELPPKHRSLIPLLEMEHCRSRDLVDGLVDAGRRAAAGDGAAAAELRASLGALVELYPLHIAKEDANLMLALEGFFTTAEQQRLDAELLAFERKTNLGEFAALLERGEGG